uniref:Uncharacterized protein n=1 Tax=viral metagenome TaxID=1070528 RepID=A0A6C0E8S6_9ZZZZ
MSTSLSELPVSSISQHQNQPDISAQQNMDIIGMIDNVAREVNANNNYQDGPNMNASALSYQMDHSQIPQHGPQMRMDDQDGDMGQYVMMQPNEPEPELTFVQKIMGEVKLPLVVLVMFFVLSLPHVNTLITRFIPRFLAENGDMTMMGLGFKAVMFAILFYLAKFFL